MNPQKEIRQVYVGGLNARKVKDIKRFFSKFGKVRDVCMKKRFCFVEFKNYQDAHDACDIMNGHDLFGDRVTVELAKSTKARLFRRLNQLN